MRKTVLKFISVFLVFLVGTCCLVMLDTICKETTGHGGNLVFDVEKTWFFN